MPALPIRNPIRVRKTATPGADPTGHKAFWTSFARLFLPAAGLVMLVGLLYGQSQQREAVSRLTVAETHGVELAELGLREALQVVVRDLKFLAAMSSFRAELDQPGISNLNRLLADMLSFSQTSGLYDQIRWIDESGMERARINRRDEESRIVPADRLQSKHDRYYFSDTAALSIGEVYMSPFDLNVEQGIVEKPRRPVIRIGTPVRDTTGQARGVLVLNYDGGNLLAKLVSAAGRVGQRLALLNSDGYWLRSPHPEDEWGFMFGATKRRFGTRHGAVWDAVLKTDWGHLSNAQGIWSWRTIRPLVTGLSNNTQAASRYGHERFWKIISHLDSARLAELKSGIWWKIVAAQLVLLAILAAGARKIVIARQHLLLTNLQLEDVVQERTQALNESVETLTRAMAERAEALQRLSENETRLRAIFDGAPDGILLAKLDSLRITEANTAACRLIGHSREHMVGLRVEDLYPHEKLPAVLPIFRHQTTGEVNTLMDIPVVRANGEHLFADIRTARLELGGKSYVVGFFHDITERKRAQEALHLAASVFESTAEGVLITDAKNKIVQVNRAFEEITGFSLQDVEGRDPNLLASHHHDAGFFDRMWHALDKNGHWQGELWNQRRNGEIYPQRLTISQVRNSQGEISNHVCILADITKVKESERKLRYLAHHDPLTGLPNRALLIDRLQHAIHQATRRQGLFAVVFADLDNFKHINDSAGHPVGDRVLQQVAEVLAATVREADTVARLGGDEFVLLLEDLSNTNEATDLAERVLRALSDLSFTETHKIRLSASLGICLYPRDGTNPETLMRNADAAMYRAKSRGRDTFEFYTETLTSAAIERVRMESQLRRALEQDELFLVYQPQVDLIDGQIRGVEALIRWRHPDFGSITPDKFIPLAEETGLIHGIGGWVLRNACAQGQQWREQGYEFGRVSVNVAGQQVRHGHLYEDVVHVLEETGLAATCLELEVTESSMMQETATAIDILTRLRDLGIMVSVDDFGTGYSSLSYLKRLPIQKLKIDKSFVNDIPKDSDDMAITEAIIALGNSLKLAVIAEGVEQQAQADFLKQLGCQLAQGYLFHRPMPADQLTRLFKASVET